MMNTRHFMISSCAIALLTTAGFSAAEVPARATTSVGVLTSEDVSTRPVTTQPTRVDNRPSRVTTRPATSVKTVRVKAGDTLGKIAQRYGVSVAQLKRLNKLSDAQANKLKVGQVIRIA